MNRHYFYFNAGGQKQGPINEQQLQELAANGTIQQNTLLETDKGQKGFAGQLSGLTFLPPRPPIPQELPVTPSEESSQKEEDGSECMSTETMLQCIFSLILVSLCFLKFYAITWSVFFSTATLTVLVMIKLYHRQVENRLKNGVVKGDRQAQYELGCMYQRQKKR